MPAPTPPARQIQGVLFDLDGVLLESEPFLVRAAIAMFAEKGVQVAEADFNPYFGKGEDALLQGVAQQHGVTMEPVAAKNRTYGIYLDMIHGVIQPLPGVHDFLRKCRQNRLRIALASSGDLIKVVGNLSEIHLSIGSFDAAVTGSDITHKKPAPDVFALAAYRLGLDPSQCLVVEDAIAGVAAAKSAGARCLAVTTNYSAEQLHDADWIAADLAHAPADCLTW